MSKLLDQSLRKFILYAGIVLVCCVPIYYFAISRLWQYELDEHNVIVTPEAGREDKFLIIGAVTLLSVIFFVLLIIGLVLVNRRLSQRLWQPFYKSLEKIRGFDLDRRKDVSFEKTGITEFDELNDSLRRLIGANLDVYNQQKEFADNASHELQTPLAIVQSKLELLSQNDALTDEQYHLIEEALAAVARAGRINKNLLLLTKIENSQFADKQSIDIGELLQELGTQFAPFFDNKHLRTEMRISGRITVEGNRSLMEILLSNLLTNAIRYTPTGGTVTITLSKGRLLISNPGTASLNADQLFRRFASASASVTGTGLGLALVKQICLRYQWQASYQFENGQHHFSILFSS